MMASDYSNDYKMSHNLVIQVFDAKLGSCNHKTKPHPIVPCQVFDAKLFDLLLAELLEAKNTLYATKINRKYSGSITLKEHDPTPK
jgi:hypothetical protein